MSFTFHLRHSQPDRINTQPPTALSTASTAPARIAKDIARTRRDVNAMQDYYLPGVLAEELLVAADFGDALRVKALIEKVAAPPARPAAGRPGAKVSFLRE